MISKKGDLYDISEFHKMPFCLREIVAELKITISGKPALGKQYCARCQFHIKHVL